MYLILTRNGERIECLTPGEAVSEITRRQFCPEFLDIWEGEFERITFEDLQRMVGHDPLDISTVDSEVDTLVEAIDSVMGSHGLSLVEARDKRLTSTSGIPCGHASVERLYGEPCVMIALILTTHKHLADEPRRVSPTELREFVREAVLGHDLGGWAMVHGECSSTMRIPREKPWRVVEMFLSKPRAEFDVKDEDEEYDEDDGDLFFDIDYDEDD